MIRFFENYKVTFANVSGRENDHIQTLSSNHAKILLCYIYQTLQPKSYYTAIGSCQQPPHSHFDANLCLFDAEEGFITKLLIRNSNYEITLHDQ